MESISVEIKYFFEKKFDFRFYLYLYNGFKVSNQAYQWTKKKYLTGQSI